MLLWTIYLNLAAAGESVTNRVTARWRHLRARPEAGDINIATAIYAALAVTLAAVVVAAITAAVKSNVAKIR